MQVNEIRDHGGSKTECWEWSEGVTEITNITNQMWGQIVGSVPSGHTLESVCRGAACVRPSHHRAVIAGVRSRESAIRQQYRALEEERFDDIGSSLSEVMDLNWSYRRNR